MTTRSMTEQENLASSQANSVLLANMREMMEEMRRDIVGSFESVIADVVKREVTGALAPLETKITSFASTISGLEEAANDHDERLTSLQAAVGQLRGEVDSLTKKCEDLEGRSRLNNIRILGVAEQSEGPRPTEFVSNLLQDLLQLDAKPVLDRAHRTLRPRPSTSTAPPRAFVVRVNQFQMRNEILRRARQQPSLIHNGKRVFIFPDFAPTVAKKRAAFVGVKKELHSCPGIKFGLFHPAILRITLSNGQTHTFEDPDCAMDFVKKNLKTMVAPSSI